jgi:hypothetical protein
MSKFGRGSRVSTVEANQRAARLASRREEAMRWRIALCAVLVGQTIGFDAEAAVLLGFVDSGARLAMERAVAGAVSRLSTPRCQLLFDDFSDASGQALSTILLARNQGVAAWLAQLRFIDDSGALQCRQRRTLAFGEPGGHVIHVCGSRFRARFFKNQVSAEVIVIHELLHTLGLGENPPDSETITARVAERCRA